MPRNRNGTLPLDVLKRVLEEAGSQVERVDFYNYGEPFLYKHLAAGLRHARRVMPATTLAISTDGLQVRESVEGCIVGERLLDWLIFSIDGCDAESYARYRIRGDFDKAMHKPEAVPREGGRRGHPRRLAVRRVPMERPRRSVETGDRDVG